MEKVYRIITMQLGTSLMVAVKAKMKAAQRRRAGGGDQPRRGRRCAREFPEIQWLFFEPDIAD